MASDRGLTQEPPDDELPEDVRRALKRQERFRLFVVVLGIILFVIVPILLPDNSPLKNLARGVGSAMSLWGSFLLAGIEKWFRRSKLSDVAPMDDLYRSISFIAGKLGMTLRDLRIDDGLDGRQFVDVSIPRLGRVILSRRAVEVMDTAELEFLLAFKLRAINAVDLGLYVFLFLIPFALAGVAVWLALSDPVQYALMVAVGVIALLSLPAIFVLWHRVRFTRNRHPAILSMDSLVADSALAKMVRYSREDSSLMNEMKQDPEVKARIGALREAANQPEGSEYE